MREDYNAKGGQQATGHPMAFESRTFAQRYVHCLNLRENDVRRYLLEERREVSSIDSAPYRKRRFDDSP